MQTLTQKVTSDLKPGEGEGEGKAPDISKVFASIGKILGEPSKEMDDVKSSLNNLSGGFNPGAPGAPGADGVAPPPAFNFGSIFSSLMQPPPLHATHQEGSDNLTPPDEKPLLPIGEKTVVLEVTQQELNDEITKKFTIDVAEKGHPSDVFALELNLEKNKHFYKFLLKERNLNLSFLLDIK